MSILQLLADSIPNDEIDAPAYWYEGRCPKTGDWLRLPRTCLAEAIARHLMQQLAADEKYAHEGKMYGVLVVETPTGALGVVKAFSGLLHGSSLVAGWVPTIPGNQQIALEAAQTLTLLEAIKQELITLQQLPERQQYSKLAQEFETRLRQLTVHHHQRQSERQQQRQLLGQILSGATLEAAIESLNQQSRQDGIARRQLKRQRDRGLQPLKHSISQADAQIHQLKQQRKAISQNLQAQMQASYWLTNFAGESLPLSQLIPSNIMPTGTGDCCAPKLLHYAAAHNLKPLGMAEFWWGPASNKGDKIQGEFYGACVERCQPLMGFLLSGLSQQEPIAKIYSHHLALPILHQDDWLIAVDKPAGLLSVPGRYHDRQDSVFSRLRHLLPDGLTLKVIHRLDQETSGVLLLARDALTHRALSQQFQQQRVGKLYEAVLTGSLAQAQGIVDLPLWGDPHDRPMQKVDWQQGKPSLTKFRVLARTANTTRVEFMPLTGRTHQLRVHAADAQGLGAPILGDRLYGDGSEAKRLHLHAKELCFEHPHLGQIRLQSVVTF